MKQKLAGMPPVGLALLAQFLDLRITTATPTASTAASQTTTPNDIPAAVDTRAMRQAALSAQLRLQLLAKEVALASRRAAEMHKHSSSSSSSQPVSAPGAALSPYWLDARPPPSHLPDLHSRSGSAQQGGFLVKLAGGHALPSPAAVSALLGEAEGREFQAWLAAGQRGQGEEEALAAATDATQQPYELLADQHRQQDTQRFITMEHDPGLHLQLSSAPRPWQEVGLPGGQGGEEAFLAAMRPLLNSYLVARGMRPMLHGEWSSYRQGCLQEWAAFRQQHEAALHSQGQSAWFNSRAESLHLRQLLAAGMPPGEGPLAEAAPRYLAALEANSSWTYSQKKHVVLRLIELARYFAKQPGQGVKERGSPFAPLFGEEGTSPKLVPALEVRKSLRTVH
ncbi:hypothetical protein V8C86DRAFT_2816919 [Haematococcus lacustris]